MKSRSYPLHQGRHFDRREKSPENMQLASSLSLGRFLALLEMTASILVSIRNNFAPKPAMKATQRKDDHTSAVTKGAAGLLPEVCSYRYYEPKMATKTTKIEVPGPGDGMQLVDSQQLFWRWMVKREQKAGSRDKNGNKSYQRIRESVISKLVISDKI